MDKNTHKFETLKNQQPYGKSLWYEQWPLKIVNHL